MVTFAFFTIYTCVIMSMLLIKFYGQFYMNDHRENSDLYQSFYIHFLRGLLTVFSSTAIIVALPILIYMGLKVRQGVIEIKR